MKYLIFTFCLILIFSCEKESSPEINYSGAYVGNLVKTEGSLNLKNDIDKCLVVITSTSTGGAVTIAADKLFYYTLQGKISGNSLVITPKDSFDPPIRTTLSGNASFNGTSMIVDFKRDSFQVSKDYPNGILYYQVSWKGTLTKQ